jgi:hypothetical protein
MLVFIIHNLCIPPKLAKIKKLKGIWWNSWAIGGFPSNLPTISHPPTE